MRKLEAVTREIVDELGYLQRREMRMRDTNGQHLSLQPNVLILPGSWGIWDVWLTSSESTNDRVKKFSILIMIGVVGLGGWQVSL